MFLSASSKYAYGNPINGQLEVSARLYKGDTELWMAQEGIYISNESFVASSASARDSGEL